MTLDEYLMVGWCIVTFAIVFQKFRKYFYATSKSFLFFFSLTMASGTAVIFQKILLLFLYLFS